MSALPYFGARMLQKPSPSAACWQLVGQSSPQGAERESFLGSFTRRGTTWHDVSEDKSETVTHVATT